MLRISWRPALPAPNKMTRRSPSRAPRCWLRAARTAKRAEYMASKASAAEDTGTLRGTITGCATSDQANRPSPTIATVRPRSMISSKDPRWWPTA
jgi:hypothetical protein